MVMFSKLVASGDLICEKMGRVEELEDGGSRLYTLLWQSNQPGDAPRDALCVQHLCNPFHMLVENF